jgi:hypothetical protein
MNENIDAGTVTYPNSVKTIISEMDENTPIYQLTGGELIQTAKVYKDENCHIIADNPMYF